MSRRRLDALLVVALVGCGGGTAPPVGSATQTLGSDSQSSPPSQPSPPSTGATTRVAPGGPGQPQGFERVTAEVTTAAGDVCAVCLWLADTPERRGRGLMGVTDLGPAGGMVFRSTTASTTAFYMLDTPMPLSVAFFGADGSFVSSTDMAPCVDGPAAACPRYHAAAPYTDAIEVPVGELDDVGIAPGSHLVVLGGRCPPE